MNALAEIPNWPRRMPAHLAAAYCGFKSERQFMDRVDAGKFPRPIKDGRTNYWYREDLDAALDLQKGGGDASPRGWGNIGDELRAAEGRK